MDFFQDSNARFFILLLTAPLWLPVLKSLWEEINWMLRDEGGVFGQLPNDREREEFQKPLSSAEDPLVEEPILTPFDRQRGARTLGARPEAKSEEEPRGFARSGKIKQPTRFR
jgi:hypothetical protein